MKHPKYRILEQLVLELNHKLLGLAAIVAAVALTTSAFALPQQALAHSGHHNNGIKVDQDISQLNVCSNFTTCVNDASNQADIDR